MRSTRAGRQALAPALSCRPETTIWDRASGRSCRLSAARYSMPDVGYGMYFEPLLRYDVSFAGNPSKK